MVAALFLCAASGSDSRAGTFDAERFVLENGLEVVVVSDHRAPVVAHMVWYRVGGADEEPGKSGLAHFVEHLMFKGTETRGPGEMSTLLKKVGAQENAFTSHDYTGFHQVVAPDRLDLAMSLEADRMVNLRLRPEDVEAERKVVLEERNSRVANSDAARFREQVDAATWLVYPYRLPLVGWEHDIRNLRLEDMMAFYRRWYGPDNAIVTLAGDITPARARELAEKHYGPLPRRGIAPRARVAEPEQIAPRRLAMTSSQVGQTSWGRRYQAPSFRVSPADAHALEVLSVVLGGGTTSRLYRSLVIRQGKAVSAGSWYRGNAIGPTTFGVHASPADGISPEALEAAVDAEIDALLADGVTADERDTAVRRLRRAALLARDNVIAPARMIGAALATGRTLHQIETWPERIAAVSLEDLKRVAELVFRAERSVTSVLLPAARE